MGFLFGSFGSSCGDGITVLGGMRLNCWRHWLTRCGVLLGRGIWSGIFDWAGDLVVDRVFLYIHRIRASDGSMVSLCRILRTQRRKVLVWCLWMMSLTLLIWLLGS